MSYELRVIYLELSIPISVNGTISKEETRLLALKVSNLKKVLVFPVLARVTLALILTN